MAADKSSFTETTAGLVRISDGIGIVEFAPAIGGAIASYRWEDASGRMDWFRPAGTEALAQGNAGEMSCFPLVPFSNRVRDGCFRFAGHDVHLPVSIPDDPHFEHGHGWRNRWEADVGTTTAVMRYEHEADSWPWHYEATQRLELSGGTLAITLQLRNLSQRPMPAGFGLHPYFPSTPFARVEAAIDKMWETDSEILPTMLIAPAPGADPNSGITVSQVALDNVFTGWSRCARIVWPEHRRMLEIRATAPLDFFVLYTPKGEPYFAAEPVSNATDAFNLTSMGRSDTGMIELQPGESLSARVEFIPDCA